MGIVLKVFVETGVDLFVSYQSLLDDSDKALDYMNDNDFIGKMFVMQAIGPSAKAYISLLNVSLQQIRVSDQVNQTMHSIKEVTYAMIDTHMIIETIFVPFIEINVDLGKVSAHHNV